MKTEKQTICLFRDISKSRIPFALIKSVTHDDFKIIFSVETFSADSTQQYILFYYDDEVARDDFSRFLRFCKKMNGK